MSSADIIYTRTDVAALTHVDPAERIDIVVRYAARDARFPGDRRPDIQVIERGHR